jgi:hypothetical protein
MNDFLIDLRAMQEGNQKKEQESFWSGHSLFQVPFGVLRYKGTAETLVLLYFYERANSVSFYSKSEVVIEIPVKEKTIAVRTGLNEDTVSDAIVSLEADDCIRVSRRRDPLTKQIRLSVYLLLHSQTKNPLTSTPGVFGVCHHNFERPYISAPKETREQLRRMKPGGRAAYLSALALASRRVSTKFGVTRDEWKAQSQLGKNAFHRGLRECELRNILSYKRGVLTLNDPKTGNPSQRTSASRVEHANPRWRFDLNAVTAEQWQDVIGRLLHRTFIVGSDGWTRTERGSMCPFCKKERCFTVNFTQGQYRCHNEECKSGRGRLGQLVQRVLGLPMARAKAFIAESTKTPATAA